jgi:hypothetical protein
MHTRQSFPIAAGQTISQPYTVAVQTMLLNVGKRISFLKWYRLQVSAAVHAEGVRSYTIEGEGA